MRIIECKDVSKSYRYFEKPAGLAASVRSLFHRQTLWRQSLRLFSFEMEKGEFLGLMGPNGAGKSTLIKVLTGIIAPTDGDLSVLGMQPFTAGATFKKRFAVVMGQKSQLWWDLPSADTLLLQKSIYEIPEERYRRNLNELSELFDVRRLMQVPVRQLSLGERMKFELICALLHDPELLFLDEPTLGLDAAAQLQIRRLLKAAGEMRGVSLLLTSHYTEDLIELTPRVMVIRAGEKVYDGSLPDLLHAHSRSRLVHVDLVRTPQLHLPPEQILSRSGDHLDLKLPAADAPLILSELFAQSVIRDLRVEDEDVTALVERLYQEGGAAQ